MDAAITIGRVIANGQSNRLTNLGKPRFRVNFFLLTIRPDVRLGVQGR